MTPVSLLEYARFNSCRRVDAASGGDLFPSRIGIKGWRKNNFPFLEADASHPVALFVTHTGPGGPSAARP